MKYRYFKLTPANLQDYELLKTLLLKYAYFFAPEFGSMDTDRRYYMLFAATDILKTYIVVKSRDYYTETEFNNLINDTIFTNFGMSMPPTITGAVFYGLPEYSITANEFPTVD